MRASLLCAIDLREPGSDEHSAVLMADSFLVMVPP